MPDWENEYREAKQKLEDHDKKIKVLEKRLDAQYHEAEGIRKRLRELESKVH
jgi:chromosome segregation ATPase